ncbi:hypothetical protein D9757_008003 [Collybiopsis confluens]|uniref:Exportin-T n=1 Tax=Collybiopsis confluens TaxID=2823264 RepID=A0A8H5H601_9AGAR|nr:hypothetical protein D9757_008003 [Collybiopsis confluens]
MIEVESGFCTSTTTTTSMDQEIEQVLQAIAIASDPSQQSLHQQAINYLNTIQQNASGTWRLALALFVDLTSEGSRKYPSQARFFALRVLDDFFDNRFEAFDPESFHIVQQALLSYIHSEYVYGSAETSATYLRNKFSHTLTLFFLCTYVDQWQSFFADLFSLIRPPSETSFNRHVSLLFFHLIVEISGEVADQMIKAARSHNPARLSRDGRVRDAVRERDAVRINEAVLTIVTEATEKLVLLRKHGSDSPPIRQLEEAEEVVDWGIRTFGSYVGWIDISLTVTPSTVPLLFSLLADPSLPIRLATSAAILKILTKGLKEPGDKLQLIKVLSLGQVIDALETKTRAQQRERGDNTDEGEESYRESLGKLLNALGLELIKLEECPADDVRAEANGFLQQILPVIVRFMSDEYDDTCSTVFLLLSTILSGYKRARKSSSGPIEPEKRNFLVSLLQVILEKLKWDKDADTTDMDDDENVEFEDLRKELRVFMDSVLAIDQDLVTEAVRTLSLTTTEAYKNGVEMEWNQAELGVYLVYIFGEINKSGGKGRAAFCLAPAMSKDVPKDLRRTMDYSEYPLTTHGELLFALVQSGMSAHPNETVALQFFETVSRYSDFFKECRNDVPLEFVPNIAQSIRDLLPIEVQLPNPEEIETDMLTDAVKSSSFDAQLYLFETLGILISLMYKSPVDQKALLLSFVKPLMDELSEALQASASLNLKELAAGGDVIDITPVVRLHHLIMALGNTAKGFPDYPLTVPANYILPPVDVFAEIAQAILVCLENTNVIKFIRDATRFAFARILATAGPNVTHFIPPLMGNLLVHFEPTELVDFMNFIGLLIFKLQAQLQDDMFDVLDELVSPLTSHISTTLSQPISGSDEQIAHWDTKKAYLALSTSVISARLQGVFISTRNKSSFDSLMETMRILAQDATDPANQKAAFNFLSRCVTVWARQPNPNPPPATNGNGNHNPLNDMSIPGFERYIYEALIPTAFGVPSLPDLNPKDGQVTVVLHEIANFLQAVMKTRGSEAENYLLNVYLPSQNWPQEAAMDMTTKIRDLDSKAFRKYFTDFVRSSSDSTAALVPVDSEWQTIFHDSNQVVLYNPTSHALSIKPRPPCPYCKQPLPLGFDSPWHSEHEHSYEDNSTRASNYFHLLAIANETNSSPSTRTSSPRVEPIVVEDEEVQEENLKDRGGTVFPTGTLAEGYFKAFFKEECKLGMGANGSVFLCQHMLDGNALGYFAVKKIAVGESHAYLLNILRECVNVVPSSELKLIILHSVLMQWADGGRKVLNSRFSLDDYIDVRLGREPRHGQFFPNPYQSENINPLDPAPPHIGPSSLSTPPSTSPSLTKATTSLDGDAQDTDLHPRSARIRAFRAFQRASPQEKERIRNEQQFRESQTAGSSNQPTTWMPVHLLSAEEVNSLFKDIVEGLGFLHDRSILHLDLKPGNVLLTWDDGRGKMIPRAMLSDFGTSRDMLVSSLNRSGNTGTLEYSSPECLPAPPTGHLRQIDSKADMWSLGMVLHRMLFFRLPWRYAMDAEGIDSDTPLGTGVTFGNGKPKIRRPPPRDEAEKMGRLEEEVLSYPGFRSDPKLVKAFQGRKLPQAILILLENLLNPIPSKRPTCEQVKGAVRDGKFNPLPENYRDYGSSLTRNVFRQPPSNETTATSLRVNGSNQVTSSSLVKPSVPLQSSPLPHAPQSSSAEKDYLLQEAVHDHDGNYHTFQSESDGEERITSIESDDNSREDLTFHDAQEPDSSNEELRRSDATGNLGGQSTRKLLLALPAPAPQTPGMPTHMSHLFPRTKAEVVQQVGRRSGDYGYSSLTCTD